eukprot:SAG31_NODE_5114_length_2732_cov_1.888340_3_plen_272_part_00
MSVAEGPPAAPLAVLDWDALLQLRRRVTKVEQLTQDVGAHWRSAMGDLEKLLQQWRQIPARSDPLSEDGSPRTESPIRRPRSAAQWTDSSDRFQTASAVTVVDEPPSLSETQLMILRQPLPVRPETSHGRGQTRDAMRPPMVAIDERDPELERIARYERERGPIAAATLPAAVEEATSPPVSRPGTANYPPPPTAGAGGNPAWHAAGQAEQREMGAQMMTMAEMARPGVESERALAGSESDDSDSTGRPVISTQTLQPYSSILNVFSTKAW